MLIDGEKWACEACVRGHRVTTCKHHDRPLIRINRKGRPFSTCSVCHRSPCPTPDEHSKLRQADQNPANRLPPGRAARPPASFLPIAPRPASSSPSAAAPVAAAAAAGSRRESQQGAGADRNRPVDPLMSAYPGPSVQGYGHGHGHGHGHMPGHGYPGVSRGHTHAGYSAVSHGVYPPSTLDPAQLALGASAGAYAATVPVSLPMAGGERDMFFEGGFVDDAAALEGLDLDEVLREGWSWLDSGAGAGAGPAPL